MPRVPDPEKQPRRTGLSRLRPSLSCQGRHSRHARRGSPASWGRTPLTIEVGQPVRRVLLVGLRTLGDVVLTTGAIPFFREHFPEARVDYLTRPAYASLLADEQALHRVLQIPGRSGISSFEYLRRYGAFLKQLRESHYDLVIDFFVRGPRSRLITLATGAPLRMGMITHESLLKSRINALVYTRRISPPVQIPRETDRVSYLLSRISRTPERTLPCLTVTEENIRETGAFLEKHSPSGQDFWVLFYGSGIPQKNWHPDRFAEIARRLAGTGVDVYCLGGEMDRAAEGALARSLGSSPPGIHFGTQLPWGILKGLCHLAKGAVGNDSGPLHLAQAVGCPSVVVFGPGDHVSYPPFLGRAVFGSLACQPCQSFAGHCPDNQCMTAVSVETVWEAIRTLPSRTPLPEGIPLAQSPRFRSPREGG